MAAPQGWRGAGEGLRVMPEKEEENKGWMRKQLDRWTAFWIMVGGVCAILLVVLTLALLAQSRNTSTGPTPLGPTTPAPTTPAPTTPAPTTPPATLVYDFNFTGSSQYPCSEEGTIHTVTGGSEVSFDFVNNSSTSLQIIWLNGSGNRQTMDTVGSGDTYSTNSYTGDDWLIASPDATCEGIFFVEGEGGVTITSSS
jgi:hypothetical protein